MSQFSHERERQPFSYSRLVWLFCLVQLAALATIALFQIRRETSADFLTTVVVVVLVGINAGLIIIGRYQERQKARANVEFTASLCHELGAPLSTIELASDNLALGHITGARETEKYASVIREQAHQMADLVNQLLLFSTAQVACDQYQLEALDVADLIDRAIRNTKYLVQRSGFGLEIKLEPGLPFVVGDPRALSLCLQNLLLNAVKYGGDDRRIEVCAKKHYRGEVCSSVAISVRDHGSGIPPSDLRRIFEPFYRTSRVRAAHVAGTGLGLPLAKRIAEKMGGALAVASEVGRGTSFTVILRVAGELWNENQMDWSGREAV